MDDKSSLLDYIRRNSSWGVFRTTLKTEDYSAHVNADFLEQDITDEELELIVAYNQLTASERRQLACEAKRVLSGAPHNGHTERNELESTHAPPDISRQ